MLQLQYSYLWMSLRVVEMLKKENNLALDRSVREVYFEAAFAVHSTQHPMHLGAAEMGRTPGLDEMSQSAEIYALYMKAVGFPEKKLVGFEANR